MKKTASTATPPMVIEPPDHLSERSKTIWRSIVPRRAKSPERLELLTVALSALHRAEQARLAIAETGMTTTTKSTGAIHVNPLVKIERESRAQFLSACGSLNLHWDPRMDGGN